ncbi:hypothetical protein MRB53_016417 [Persea americana]|uniref:Uncharacterized protein n=1 Tax=Persea americana TaxID=3435 RepID=A0ACC2M2T0_PERAE|nr:hypothetical protein MRB53_016417 [Persea americana]
MLGSWPLGLGRGGGCRLAVGIRNVAAGTGQCGSWPLGMCSEDPGHWEYWGSWLLEWESWPPVNILATGSIGAASWWNGNPGRRGMLGS